jgi:acyl-CoA thioester hydrolase
MTEMRLPAGLELLRPLISGSGRVEPAWIDHHNHMNVGYYGVAIDACLHGFTDVVDMGKAYRDTTNCGFFVLESHQTFKSEMRLGDEFVITCQLLDYSPKLMHIMAAMYRLGDDALAATAEYLWCLSRRIVCRRWPGYTKAIRLSRRSYRRAYQSASNDSCAALIRRGLRPRMRAHKS